MNYLCRQSTIYPHGVIASWGSHTLWFMLSASHMVRKALWYILSGLVKLVKFHWNERFNLQGALMTSWPVTTRQFLQHLKLECLHSLFQSKVPSPSTPHHWWLYKFMSQKTAAWGNSLFCFLDPNSTSQGGIQFMNCVATLLTKSKTKFFIEYYSSCLESMFHLFQWLWS